MWPRMQCSKCTVEGYYIVHSMPEGNAGNYDLFTCSDAYCIFCHYEVETGFICREPCHRCKYMNNQQWLHSKHVQVCMKLHFHTIWYGGEHPVATTAARAAIDRAQRNAGKTMFGRGNQLSERRETSLTFLDYVTDQWQPDMNVVRSA